MCVLCMKVNVKFSRNFTRVGTGKKGEKHGVGEHSQHTFYMCMKTFLGSIVLCKMNKHQLEKLKTTSRERHFHVECNFKKKRESLW